MRIFPFLSWFVLGYLFGGGLKAQARPTSRPTSTVSSRSFGVRASFSRFERGVMRRKKAALRIVLLGDLMLARRVLRPSAKQVKAARVLWQGARWVIGNLETPMGPCFGRSMMRYPRLCTDQERLRSLRMVGVHGVTLANNHMLDAGRVGLEKTRQILRRWGLLVSSPTPLCGSNENLQVLRLREGAFPLWILAINAVRPRFPPVGFPSLPTPLQVERCTKRLATKATVIASIHVGREYSGQPSLWDVSYFRAAWRGGAKVLVGHHPHVPREFTMWGEVPLAWGLGNVVSDQRFPRKVRKGAGLSVFLREKEKRLQIKARLFSFRIQEGWPRR